MVASAKNRGLRVVVGTLPPQNPIAPTGTGESCVARNGGYAFVTPFNNASVPKLMLLQLDPSEERIRP